MSGVKNLRAMFEQKNEPGDSPPDRGRSPGPGNSSLGSPTPPSRPLSKVRTNFVAFEKDGRVGLRREPSGDSISASSRRLSNETDNSTTAPAQDKNDPFTENMAKNVSAFKTNLATEPIPESPVADSSAKLSPKKGTETPEITHGPNPDKIVDEEETHTKLTAADPTVHETAESTPSESNGTSEPNEKVEDAAQEEVKEQIQETSPASKPPVEATSPTPASTKTTSRLLGSPSAVRTPRSPAKGSTQETGKVPEKKPISTAPKESTSRNAALKPQPSGKKTSARDLSPAAEAVKPKVKSPTRPTKVPSSILAPTTASSSKLGSSVPPPRRSLSREPNNTRAPAVSNRPASRASGVSPAGTAPPAKTLRRQASTINRARPSLGLPPKTQAKDHPPTRKEAPVDEGFLARMMRPTQSSASKAADKVPITPPRKQVTTSTAKKPMNKDGEANAKKAATKLADIVKKDTSVKNTTTAKSEVKKTVAKTAAKNTEPSANEVAPVAAQTESAEVAIEAAKTSTDTIVVPQIQSQVSDKAKTEAAPLSEASEPTPEPESQAEVKIEVETKEAVPESTESKLATPAEIEVPATVPVEATNGTNGHALPPKAEDNLLNEGVEAIEQEKATPTIAADPKKVEDIEDVVQESSA
ncbi:hypothetical protein PFICI_15113 [Pestalotiopsis fici W106-1]|uniref:Uncharacterized protein n=1 Tax=Pestalotiopsis fici (strain W106-1 / CGMCC3.15140) TaxID=1229662 RepID=W3WGZ8_PESFW|nr:uncharacterized protein PFICI_15113 [Pestalotiopsis fici W106-1]ETS73168.1 hypothetical protein PFICI_15113 [Pestalotiopsis fici W106-1]